MQRYFAKEKINENFILSYNDIHHIKNVMRMNIGDLVEIIYNKKLYLCKIVSMDNDVEFEIVEEILEENELPKYVTIAFSLSKEEKMDLIFQKCSELGIKEFIPLRTERCVVKVNKEKEAHKLDRWRKICKEASEQSKRNIIPIINKIYNIKDIVNLDYDLKILCSVNQSVINIKDVLKKYSNCDRIIFVIGPEGGLTDEEEKYLIENGYIPTSLGKRVLRMETAPIMVGSVINYEYME